MLPYDGERFEPPAPVAYVTLRDPQSTATLNDIPMLIDTGADVTLLPRQLVQQVGVAALPDRRYELIGFDGSTSFAEVVRLDLFFLNKQFRGQFLLTDQSTGILGRNILIKYGYASMVHIWHGTNFALTQICTAERVNLANRSLDRLRSHKTLWLYRPIPPFC